MTPAPATRPSSVPPHACSTAATIASRPAAVARSATISASRTSTPTTRCPSASSRAHVARPIPPAAPVTTMVPMRAALVDEDVRSRQALLLARGVVEGERPGAVGDPLDVAVGVEVEVHAVHLEPHARLVLDAMQRVHRSRGFVEERPRAVHVLVLLVLPRAARGVAPHRAGVPVRLHLEALGEDVLDDPE